MKRKPISLALGQIEVASGELDENLDRALNAVNQASRMGAQIILLPECLDFGWCSDASLKGAAPIPGPITNKLVDASRDANILIAAGLSERDGCKLYNASVLIDPVLGLVGKHRKINELDFAKAIYAGGDKVRAFNTSLGRIAIPICADLLDQSIRKEIGEIGADVILSPAAWAVSPSFDELATPYGQEWFHAYSSIAKQLKIPVAGVSHVGRLCGGPWDNWPVIGKSLVIDKDGNIAAFGQYNEPDLVIVNI